jgi:SAM-dependent methyltransferase
MSADDLIAAWLHALDERHLADLTPSEAARALRALSSCYVERRDRLAKGGALDSAGKRAAFALFYSPLHFIVTREIVRALPGAAEGLRTIADVGCGTGAAGAAWAIESGGGEVRGFDRNAWAVGEANWTYRVLRIRGRALHKDATRVVLPQDAGAAAILAYTANELPESARSLLLERLLRSHEQGARALIVEPISRRTSPWWGEWERAIRSAGGRADEWRFPSALPERQRGLAKAAGLDPRELTARTLYLPGSRGSRASFG